eukprot:TRINITY_DN6859_c0_g1_i1.p1 TRINITY_DN6859_c0_g1~~TRINITY_DN6859_c0_g1_i1.p1  ORF type:complete len:1442 (+),score=690.48 TRINITY_DN6859_c0_g1_i1:85-4410(+)
MAPAIEVDLTSATPPKKMKQARLPFAPVNNQKELSESGRKRKHSEEETITPNKNPKKDVKSPVKSVKSKENSATDTTDKVAATKKDDQENNPDVAEVKSTSETSSEKVTDESAGSSKKKASKSKQEKTKTEEAAKVEGPEKFKGLLKMPFKTNKKNVEKESKVDSDDDIELDVSSAEVVDKSSIETPNEETSMTSMTEEWAKFHENSEVGDQSMEEVETSQTEGTPKSSKKKTKAEKEEKLKLKLEEKARKEEEKANAKAEKEGRKRQEKMKSLLLKEEKEKSKEKVKKEKTPKKGKVVVEKLKDSQESKEEQTKEEVIELDEDKDVKVVEKKEDTPAKEKKNLKKENTPAKVNPLAKFLVKAKVVETKEKCVTEVKKTPETETNKDDDDILIVEEVKPLNPSPVPATSTPVRTSPRKKVSLAKTPSTPFTPDPDRAKKLSIAKLKVKISELNMAMDKAVEEKDFLKAHETKQAIQKLEGEVIEIDADTSYVSQSLDVSGVAASAESTPKVTPKATPKNSRNVSVVSTPGSANVAPSMFKKVTPGQLAKQEEMKKKREAFEKEKQAKKEALEKEKQTKKEELEKEKQSKKEALENEKAEKERQKEVEKRAKELERLEKERVKKSEKDKLEAEKEKLKQEKEEERLKKKAEKEAELKQKEEERLKKEEEKRLLEEAEKEKVKKKAQAFKSFFKKDDVAKERKVSGKEVEEVAEGALGNFTLFRVKDNMRLAPTVRNDPKMAMKRIDSLDMPAGPDGLYLALLKTKYNPGKQSRTWPYEKNVPKDDDVEIIEDEEEEESDPEDAASDENNDKIIINGAVVSGKVPRAKLLQFHANQRPAYWGTWTKQSAFVSGRRPFGKDEERFEYDYESDEDWEEEEEGESLSDNEDDGEKEEEKDDYEVDNEFFVPHGYLSDEEEEKDEDEVFNPETAKEKLKHAEKEFEKEHKKKTQQLKPRLWGVCFEGETLDTEAAASQLVKILGGFKGIIVGNNNTIETGLSKPVMSPTAVRDEKTESASVKNSSKGGKSKPVPDEAVPHLIKLLHGNSNNKMFLAREFIEFWNKASGEDGSGDTKADDENVGTPSGKQGSSSSISKRKMINKILEIADYKRLTEGGVKCWWVKEEVLTKLEITPATTNEWSYILEQPKNKNSNTDDLNTSRPGSPSIKVAASPNPASLITKFARVLTDEEREEQKAKQEKEALLARLKREAAKAEQAAKEAKLKADQAAAAAASVQVEAVPVAKQPLGGGMTKFTKVLSTEEHKARLAQGSSPAAGKKRVALTPVSQASPIAVKRGRPPMANMSPANAKKATLTPAAKVAKVAKKNPLAAMVSDKELNSPKTKIASPITVKKTPSTAIASPILVKKTPGSGIFSPAPSKKGLKISTPEAINAKASPIAIRRKPKTPLSFQGKIGTPTSMKNLPGVTVTPVRSSPRKKTAVECVTLD